jgi:CheY-like chemotaxis protein
MPTKLILHIDDDFDDLEMLTTIISNNFSDIIVYKAKGGKEAIGTLSELEKENLLPSLVILDINMPEMSGREVLEVLKSHSKWNRIPVAVFSTSNNSPDVKFFDNHDVKVFVKPNHIDTWHSVVSDMVSLSK